MSACAAIRTVPAMNEHRRYHPSFASARERPYGGRPGPSWLVFAAVRPWILPVVDRKVDFGDIDEPKSLRPAHDPYEWMKRIKPDR
jgi:hypothetical protein